MASARAHFESFSFELPDFPLVSSVIHQNEWTEPVDEQNLAALTP